VHYKAWVLASLQGVAARCLWQCGRWALMEITSMPQQKRRALGWFWLPDKIYFYAGVIYSTYKAALPLSTVLTSLSMYHHLSTSVFSMFFSLV